MRRLLEFLTAELTVVAVIVINTVALFGLAAAHTEKLTSIWFIIDYVCVIYFIMEMIIKVKLRGWRSYWSSGWNKFDFVIVVASVPVLLAPWVDLHQFAVVLLLRLGRLFRLFRLMRFIPNRHHLAAGIYRAVKASVGVVIALAIINIVFSIGATMLFGRFSEQHFGNPLLSIYSTFRIFTVEGWYEIPDQIAATAGHPGWGVAARIYFTISVLVGGILGFSLANAVFVDTMTMDNTEPLEEKVDQLREEIRALRAELSNRSTTDPGDDSS